MNVRGMMLLYAICMVAVCISGCEERSKSKQLGGQDGVVVSANVAGQASTNDASTLRVPPPRVSESAATAEFGFKPHRQFNRMVGPFVADYQAVAAADFNGDGRTDLVALPNHNLIDLFLQTPSGTLASPLTFTYAIENYSSKKLMVINDFNKDGISDVAFHTLNDYGTSNGVDVLLSRVRASPVHHRGYRVPTGEYRDTPADWASLDANGDGRQDLVVARGRYDEIGVHPLYEVLYGDGRGNFVRSETFDLELPGEDLRQIQARDLNNDGFPDLVFVMLGPSSERGSVWVAYRLAQGGLAPPLKLFQSPPGEHHLFFGDVNGDRRDDSIMGGAIRLRKADGSFGEELALNTFNTKPSTTTPADFDGDGLTDLVNKQFEGFYSIPFIAVYLQRNGTLGATLRLDDPPYAHSFNVGEHRQVYAVGDFNGDGCRDLAVAASYDGIVFLDGSNCIPLWHRTGGNLPPRRRM
jgi:hypothetical protein